MRLPLLSLLAFVSCGGEQRAPDCNGSAHQLADLCDLDDVDMQLHYNACAAYELGNSQEQYEASLAESDCILAAASCDEARACQGEDGGDTDGGAEDFDGDGSPEGDDCDDYDASEHPGAEEIPDDGIDQDCTGVDAEGCYTDADGDGHGTGDAAPSENGCAEGQSREGDDCDDTDASIYWGAEDIPDDGIDQNCNGADLLTCYYDFDGDGYGGDSVVYDEDCGGLDIIVGTTGDCDDGNPDVNPGADDDTGTTCSDGVDNNCDGCADYCEPACGAN